MQLDVQRALTEDDTRLHQLETRPARPERRGRLRTCWSGYLVPVDRVEEVDHGGDGRENLDE